MLVMVVTIFTLTATPSFLGVEEMSRVLLLLTLPIVNFGIKYLKMVRLNN